MTRSSFFFACALLLLASLVGCGSRTPPSPEAKGTHQAKSPTSEQEHAHKPGQFGGIIVDVGRGHYHIEAVFEKNGVLRLYTLGQDESEVAEVESQTLTAYAKSEGTTQAEEFVLKPDPREGDSEGKTSRFTGILPKDLWGKRVEITIPTFRARGDRFRVGFKSAHDPHSSSSMPAPVVGEKERALFLTPEGKYTARDIEANKGLVPSQKFKDFVAEHDDNPQPGDWICPVTATKANLECAWVVDGQTYYFCCPPCVTDWVKTAKSKPDKLKNASEYRKPTTGEKR